jgi:hypothetical protein
MAKFNKTKAYRSSDRTANGGIEGAKEDGLFRKILGTAVILGVLASLSGCSDTGSAESYFPVTARCVLIDNSKNGLASTNLQDALDNELAKRVTVSLPGTTWAITNKTADWWYQGSTGQVTFADTTLSLVQGGKFAAAGIVTDYTGLMSGTTTITTPISYEFISDSTYYVTWDVSNNISYGDPMITHFSSLFKIVAVAGDKITIVGWGGAGGAGVPRVSVLTRVP